MSTERPRLNVILSPGAKASLEALRLSLRKSYGEVIGTALDTYIERVLPAEDRKRVMAIRKALR